MHPWLLQSPPIPPVSAYGTLIVVGFVLAWMWARVRAKRAGMDVSRVDLLMPVLLAAGLVGAWAAGSLTDVVTHEQAESAVLAGSLLAATGAGVVYGVSSGMPLGVLGDACAGPLAFGIGVGRVGCFMAGCCYGRLSGGGTWLTGVCFPRGSFAFLRQVEAGQVPAWAEWALPVYPVQLYEAGLCVVLAVWLARPARGRAVAGERFLAMGLGYAILRFGLEFLRGDNPPVHGLTFSQWACVLIAVMAAVTWVLRRKYARKLNLWRDRREERGGVFLSM